MKLYDNSHSPNCRRVRMFLAEKSIELPVESVDLARGESHTPAYLTKNPMGQVPLLEFDDGSFLAESAAICRYFEEVQPGPPLFGTTVRGKAETEMWSRRVEFGLLGPAAAIWKHTSPMLVGHTRQVPEVAELERANVLNCLSVLNGALANREFLAGDRFSVADITALCALEFAAAAAGAPADPELINLARWHAAVAQRPSARA